MSPQPRRFSVDPDTPVVVTLKDYVDAQGDAMRDKIAATDKRIDGVQNSIASAVRGLEARIDRSEATATAEHANVQSQLNAFKAEVRGGLTAVKAELAALREQNAREQGSLTTVAKVAGGVVVFTTWLGGVIALIQHFAH